VIGTSIAVGRIALVLEAKTGLSRELAERLVIVGAVVLSLPFLVGLTHVSRRLAETMAEVALPRRAEVKVDLAAAPRRALLRCSRPGMSLPWRALTRRWRRLAGCWPLSRCQPRAPLETSGAPRGAHAGRPLLADAGGVGFCSVMSRSSTSASVASMAAMRASKQRDWLPMRCSYTTA